MLFDFQESVEAISVIPERASANPESNSIMEMCFWIPDRRFAASGMTKEAYAGTAARFVTLSIKEALRT